MVPRCADDMVSVHRHRVVSLRAQEFDPHAAALGLLDLSNPSSGNELDGGFERLPQVPWRRGPQMASHDFPADPCGGVPEETRYVAGEP
jgi:hypothetical protein